MNAVERLEQRARTAEKYSRINYDELARVEGLRQDRVLRAFYNGSQTPMRQLSDNHDYGQGPFIKRFK